MLQMIGKQGRNGREAWVVKQGGCLGWMKVGALSLHQSLPVVLHQAPFQTRHIHHNYTVNHERKRNVLECV